jgi:hypothetical protein
METLNTWEVMCEISWSRLNCYPFRIFCHFFGDSYTSSSIYTSIIYVQSNHLNQHEKRLSRAPNFKNSNYHPDWLRNALSVFFMVIGGLLWVTMGYCINDDPL